MPAANETHTSEVVLFDRQGEVQGSYNVMDAKEFTALVIAVEELIGTESANAETPSDEVAENVVLPGVES